MSKFLSNDYIMKFKNENEIRAHFKRYNDLRELKYTEEALSSELSNYALERNFSEVDCQLVIEKYGKFHKVILETLNEKMEKVHSSFWHELSNVKDLDTKATTQWLSRMDNFAGIFEYLVQNAPKSYKEEMRRIFQLHQDLNIHLDSLVSAPS